ncbi:transcription antitermination factor NusB [Pelagibacteraceae bacterium]|jgi:N utilization substance protein B|nr:transcription antitermination factor NusB [Pelagibacteraceae bacterium]|tara:strand:+ start:270 stop:668 length:399 start_codon:yes stop_codon:yes gene_type:complete
MPNNKPHVSPRVRVVQKLYANSLNSEVVIEYPKSQYKKFIKDVVEGTIERNDLINETVSKYLSKDLDLKRTDKLVKIIIYAAIFELTFKHNNPTKVIINEYVKTSEFFLEKAQISFVNAILDKIAKNIRKTN